MEVGGAGAAVVGALATADPVGAAPGATVMAMGGFTTWVAAGAQMIGGFMQMGSDPTAGGQNAGAGAVSVLTGAISFFLPGVFQSAGSNYAARAFNSGVALGGAFTGLGIDAGSQALPGMDPQQASCY
jgi:hypothetical protein